MPVPSRRELALELGVERARLGEGVLGDRGHGSILCVRDADQVKVDAPAWGVDRAHRDGHGIAEGDPTAGARADEDGALLVELPPVAAQAAHGQQALVAVLAEGDESAGADEAGDLALEDGAPALLVEVALEQEAASDVGGVALDEHRVAPVRRRPLPRL